MKRCRMCGRDFTPAAWRLHRQNIEQAQMWRAGYNFGLGDKLAGPSYATHWRRLSERYTGVYR